LLRMGLLGQLHHIRAQWHRGNLPGNDSWQMPLPGGEGSVNKIADQLNSFRRQLDAATDPLAIEQLSKRVAQWEAWDADKKVDAGKHGYEKLKLPNGAVRSE